MGSVGFSGGRGAGLVPALQRAWTDAVENALRVHDDRLDVLKAVADGVATSLRWPVRLVIGASVAVAASAIGLLACRIVEVAR